LQLTPSGQLRVFCHQALTELIAPGIINFLARFPAISLDMRTGDLAGDLVQEGFDLAITPHRPSDTSLVQKHLATWHLMPFCAPAFLDRHRAPERPSDLAGLNCLRYAHADFGARWSFVDAAGNMESVRVNSTLVSTSVDLLRSAATSGLGVWLMVPFGVADLLASGALVPLLPAYQGPALEVLALYPHRRHMTAKLRGLLDLLIGEFARAPHRA
jgi:DNA-binding transcriptional LysR family regulator